MKRAEKDFQVEYQNQKWDFEVHSLNNRETKKLNKKLGIKYDQEKDKHVADPEKLDDFNVYLCMYSLNYLKCDGEEVKLEYDSLNDSVPKAVLEHVSKKIQEFNVIDEKKSGGLNEASASE